MKRGEIWWASMDGPVGSEPGYRRPVVIVSSNDFNNSLIQTIVAVTVTSNLRLLEAPGNFKLTKAKSGLTKDSVVNISQVVTLDKSFLTEKSGDLSLKQIQFLNEGLKLVLDL